MILRLQLNVMFKEIFKIDNIQKIDNKIEILKLNSNDKYYVINNTTKLQKIMNAASNKTKRINFKIENSDIH